MNFKCRKLEPVLFVLINKLGCGLDNIFYFIIYLTFVQKVRYMFCACTEKVRRVPPPLLFMQKSRLYSAWRHGNPFLKDWRITVPIIHDYT